MPAKSIIDFVTACLQRCHKYFLLLADMLVEVACIVDTSYFNRLNLHLRCARQFQRQCFFVFVVAATIKMGGKCWC